MTTEVFMASGVWASAGKEAKWIDLKEIKAVGETGHVGIKIGYDAAGLRPAEAKKLADQLYEMASRAETRGK